MPLSTTDKRIAIGPDDRDGEELAWVAIQRRWIIAALCSRGEVIGNAEELGVIGDVGGKLASGYQDTIS